MTLPVPFCTRAADPGNTVESQMRDRGDPGNAPVNGWISTEGGLPE